LDQAGFWVFGGLEIRMIVGGNAKTPQPFPCAIIQVLRKNNPIIVSKPDDTNI
jgi:hypothetical protein